MVNKALPLMCYSKQNCWGCEVGVLKSNLVSCPFKEPLWREREGEKLCLKKKKNWFRVEGRRNKEAYQGKLNFGS